MCVPVRELIGLILKLPVKFFLEGDIEFLMQTSHTLSNRFINLIVTQIIVSRKKPFLTPRSAFKKTRLVGIGVARGIIGTP